MTAAVHGYVSTRPCGCVEYVTVDDPGASAQDRAELLAQVASDERRGLTVKRLPLADVRKAAGRMGYCNECRPVPEGGVMEDGF